MKKLFFLLTAFTFCISAGAQSSEIVKKYIATYKDIAIDEMHRTGVPAAITLAQGIHETGAGQSVLVKKSNNHFGIKCKSEWKGESVTHDDDAKGECFRKYDDPMDSYRDHSDFLKNRSHYAALFKLDPTDYEAWAYGLKKAGYATNPKYPQILIKLIRDYSLQEYTLIALERKGPSGDNVILANNISASDASTSGKLASDEADAAFVAASPAYPSGKFSINKTDVIYAQKGTSYLKIAEENGISVARLFDFNDLTAQDIVAVDQLIFLERKRKIGAKEFHIVQPGETLHSIAQTEGIRLVNLMEFNWLRQGMMPKAGEKLYLQEKAAQMPKLISDSELSRQSGPVVQEEEQNAGIVLLHTVQPKETMYAIAKKYEVRMEDVMNWNNLQGKELKIGQQLRIHKKAINGHQASR
jgi:LysM repeat protein